MGAFTWAYDAATGVYKNNHLSGQLLKLSAKDFKFVPFTKKVDSYGKGMGESVTLIYYKALALPGNGQLEEETRIPIDPLTMGKQSITIKEWGRGVEYTDIAKQLSKFDPDDGAQGALKDQMNDVMDNAAANEFTGTDVKIAFIPTSLTGGTWDTDGTASTQATENITKAHLGVIRDYMAKDIHTPFFETDHYIGMFATKALRGLKQDKAIEAWMMYLRKGDLIFKSEIGRCESTRLIEVNNESALSNSIGTSNILGQGVVFGKEAVARIEIEFPHLRAQPNYKGDFGRRHAVAWYGTVAYGVFWPTSTDREAKIVRVDSA